MKTKKHKRKRRKLRSAKAQASVIPEVLHLFFASVETKLQEYAGRRAQLAKEVGQLDQGIIALQGLKKLPHATLVTIQALGTGASQPGAGRRPGPKTVQSMLPLLQPLMAGVPSVDTIQSAILGIIQVSPGMTSNQLLALAKSSEHPRLRGATKTTISGALNALNKKRQAKYSGLGRHGTWSAN